MRHSVIVAAALLLVSLAGRTHALELSSTRPIVLIRDQNAAPAHQAGKLLEKHLARLTARPVVQGKEPAKDGLTIYLGRTPFVESRFGARLNAMPSAESYIIETVGDDSLVLAGKAPDGTLNAAVEFLRRHCGVEEYIPGDLGTVYSRPAPIILPEIHEDCTPPFRHRVMYVPVRNAREAQGAQEWLYFHHRVIAIEFHHNLFRLLPPTKYAKEHPEYYAEVDGRRRIFTKDISSGWQPCMTNEAGIRAVAEELIRLFDADPNRLSVSIGVNDGGNYCTCARCKPLWLDTPTKRGQCGRLYYTYANKIAELVAAKYPGRILGCLAYSSAGGPPDGLALHPMIMPFVTVMSQCATTDELWNTQVKSEIDQVARNAKQFGLYEYLHGAGMYVPCFYDSRIAQTFRYAWSKGCRAAYFEAGAAWGMDVYKHALAMRLLWDPALDVPAWKKKFLNDFYGAAAPAMGRYFAACEKAWGRVEHSVLLHKREEQMALFDEPLIAECEAALGEAAQKAADDAAFQRIVMVQRAFAGSAALVRRHWAGVRAMDALDRRTPKAEVIALLAPVAGPEFDYPVLHALGPAREPYQTATPPDDGSVRMEATYTEARARLFSGLLDEVARDVRGQPALLTDDAALRRTQSLFSGVRAANADRLMLDALKISRCVARVRKAETAPLLDGQLRDEVWAKAEPLGSFVTYGSGANARFITTVRMLQADGKLFLGFDCRQPGDQFWAAAGMRDGRVWTDDSIEVFLNKPGETDPEALVHFMVNVEGVIYDSKGKDEKWDGPFEARTSRDRDGWQLEVAVPMEFVKEFLADGACRMNFVRNKQRVRQTSKGPNWEDYDEISNWFPAYKGSAQLASRGWVLFEP